MILFLLNPTFDDGMPAEGTPWKVFRYFVTGSRKTASLGLEEVSSKSSIHRGSYIDKTCIPSQYSTEEQSCSPSPGLKQMVYRVYIPGRTQNKLPGLLQSLPPQGLGRFSKQSHSDTVFVTGSDHQPAHLVTCQTWVYSPGNIQ